MIHKIINGSHYKSFKLSMVLSRCLLRQIQNTIPNNVVAYAKIVVSKKINKNRKIDLDNE